MATIPNFSAYIFDLDGVLVNSYEAWFHLINDGLQLYGSAPITEPEFRETWGQGIEADQEKFFPTWDLAEIVSLYDRSFQRHSSHVRSEPGGLQALSGLKNRGKSLAVASNSPATIIRILLDASGLSQFIDAIAGADEVAASKPAPDLIFRVLEKLESTPQSACYIGDSIFDEEAARAAGIFFIGYQRPGDLTIRSLTELISESSQS
jgi:phosphoglycolate phosphatase-like HAD superfamily hydrolase